MQREHVVFPNLTVPAPPPPAPSHPRPTGPSPIPARARRCTSTLTHIHARSHTWAKISRGALDPGLPPRRSYPPCQVARAQLRVPHLPRRLRLGVRAPDPQLPCRAGAPPHACASCLPGGPRGAEARHAVVAAPRTRGSDGRRWRGGRRCARCGARGFEEPPVGLPERAAGGARRGTFSPVSPSPHDPAWPAGPPVPDQLPRKWAWTGADARKSLGARAPVPAGGRLGTRISALGPGLPSSWSRPPHCLSSDVPSLSLPPAGVHLVNTTSLQLSFPFPFGLMHLKP